MNMITVDEAILQGSEPSLFLSIAKANSDQEIVGLARKRGRQMAARMGLDIGGRQQRPANDNAKRRRAA